MQMSPRCVQCPGGDPARAEGGQSQSVIHTQARTRYLQAVSKFVHKIEGVCAVVVWCGGGGAVVAVRCCCC